MRATVWHLALLLLVARPLTAATVATIERDGVTVPGEVCRFQAGDRDNPFQRWLASTETICVASGSEMHLGGGLWNVFGRTKDGVSSPVLVDGDRTPRILSLSAGPAATLIALLPEKQSAIVYAPRRNTGFPLPRSNERNAVPAGEELWLIVVEKSKAVAIFPVPALESGSERTIDARSAGASFVLGWVEVSEADRAALDQARGLSSTNVRISAKGPATNSYPLPSPELLHGAFVLVRSALVGDVDVSLEGRGWLRHRRRVTIERTITSITESLLARAASTVIVNWSTHGDLPSLERSLGSCEPDGAEPPQMEVEVSRCEPPQRPGEPIDTASCTVMHRELLSVQQAFGAFTLVDVAPALYRAVLRFGKLPPVASSVPVSPFRQGSMRLNAEYREIYGSLTLGGKPLGRDAMIQFPGDGRGFAPAPDGEYRAVIVRPQGPTDETIRVSTCDARLQTFFLPEIARRPASRFDIDIPDNSLTIHVTDTFTRMPISGATVRYVVMSKLVPRRPVVTQMLKTGAEASAEAGEGSVEIRHVPEREIRLQISKAGYQKYDVEPFSITRSEARTVDVQLVPLRGSTGKIVSPRPFENATVLWYSSGRETEQAEVGPDGTFVYANPHDGETMVVVSFSHPLWVLRSPAVSRGKVIELRFPEAPAREFQITIDGGRPRTATQPGLAVDGVMIPHVALRLHQSLRGLPAVMRGFTPLPIGAILETGPIDVLLSPTVDEYPGRPLTESPLVVDTPDLRRRRLQPASKAVVFVSKE